MASPIETKNDPGLTGVPETMLLTLHTRVSEAKRVNGWIKDELAIKIYDSIEYNFERNFGKSSDGVHGWRSKVFDDGVKEYLQRKPNGIVVELACGLETQFNRIDNGSVRWYCVDLPEAFAVREKYIPGNDRLVNITKSALDFGWLKSIPQEEDDVFVSMQGLLMYLKPTDVKLLISSVAKRFPKGTIMFDTIPTWLSNKSTSAGGLSVTRHFKMPPLLWGINHDALTPFLKDLSLDSAQIEHFGFRTRGFQGFIFELVKRLPYVGNKTPGMWKLTLVG